MFRKVDCVRIRVPNAEEALRFYHEKLGLDIVWKRGSSEPGLRRGESDSVLVTEKLEESEVDILVKSVDDAQRSLKDLEGRLSFRPSTLQ
ncbi:MAG TPA: VOC family protein [Candidatus Dormibacteraeota bacterium]|nr:VOC family protein [Candidatus Dormibacteraeota bacterium]